MPHYLYLPIEHRVDVPELGAYVTVGIRALRACRAGWEEEAFLPDVSCDRELVLLLTEQCNRLKLDPIHLFDVVQDALG